MKLIHVELKVTRTHGMIPFTSDSETGKTKIWGLGTHAEAAQHRRAGKRSASSPERAEGAGKADRPIPRHRRRPARPRRLRHLPSLAAWDVRARLGMYFTSWLQKKKTGPGPRPQRAARAGRSPPPARAGQLRSTRGGRGRGPDGRPLRGASGLAARGTRGVRWSQRSSGAETATAAPPHPCPHARKRGSSEGAAPRAEAGSRPSNVGTASRSRQWSRRPTHESVREQESHPKPAYAQPDRRFLKMSTIYFARPPGRSFAETRRATADTKDRGWRERGAICLRGEFQI